MGNANDWAKEPIKQWGLVNRVSHSPLEELYVETQNGWSVQVQISKVATVGDLRAALIQAAELLAQPVQPMQPAQPAQPTDTEYQHFIDCPKCGARCHVGGRIGHRGHCPVCGNGKGLVLSGETEVCQK